jgi:hypothetical protein
MKWLSAAVLAVFCVDLCTSNDHQPAGLRPRQLRKPYGSKELPFQRAVAALLPSTPLSMAR